MPTEDWTGHLWTLGAIIREIHAVKNNKSPSLICKERWLKSENIPIQWLCIHQLQDKNLRFCHLFDGEVEDNGNFNLKQNHINKFKTWAKRVFLVDKTTCKRLKTFPLPFWKRWNGCYEHINVNLTCLFLRSLRISGPAGTTVSLVGTDSFVKTLLILRPSMPSRWTEKLREITTLFKACQTEWRLLTHE